MAKISFNSQAILVVHRSHDCDMSHAYFEGADVPVMVESKAVFKRLGFTNVENLKIPTDELSTK